MAASEQWVLQENASIILESELVDDWDGYLAWLLLMSEGVNQYIENNHINGEDAMVHKVRLSRFMIAAERVCDWTVLTDAPDTSLGKIKKAYVRARNMVGNQYDTCCIELKTPDVLAPSQLS